MAVPQACRSRVLLAQIQRLKASLEHKSQVSSDLDKDLGMITEAFRASKRREEALRSQLDELNASTSPVWSAMPPYVMPTRSTAPQR